MIAVQGSHVVYKGENGVSTIPIDVVEDLLYRFVQSKKSVNRRFFSRYTEFISNKCIQLKQAHPEYKPAQIMREAVRQYQITLAIEKHDAEVSKRLKIVTRPVTVDFS